MLCVFPVEEGSKTRDAGSMQAKPLVGLQGLLFTQTLSDITEVRLLDALVRAHTLLAIMADRVSPEHQLNLLRAYTFVLQIWQVPKKNPQWVMMVFFIYDTVEFRCMCAICLRRCPWQHVRRLPVSPLRLLPLLEAKKAKERKRRLHIL